MNAPGRTPRTGPPLPEHAILLLTNRCPLQCKACGTRGWVPSNRDRELEPETWFEVLEQLWQLGCNQVKLSGGDPVARLDDSVRIVERASRIGFRTAMMTSCRDLGADRLTELYDAGLNELSTSLDGATEAAHDDWRGAPGNYREVMDTLGRARSLRGRPRSTTRDFDWSTVVMTLICDHNATDLLEIHDQVVAAGADMHMVQCLSPDEHFETYRVRSDPERFRQVVRHLCALKSAGAPILNTLGFLERVVDYYSDALPQAVGPCRAGHDSLIFAPDGSLSTCRESLSRQAKIYGDDGRLDILAAWLGEPMRAARDAMEACEERCMQACWEAD